MATQINININGFGVPRANGDRQVVEYSERTLLSEPVDRRWEDEFYTLKPGFSPVGYLHAERKIKKKQAKKCSSGQVCGFSCISKSKTCLANMTTKEFMEHNRAKRLAAAEKRKAAKAASINNATNADNKAMPQIIGSEKQVKWATEIRDNLMDSAKKSIDKAKERIDSLLQQNTDGSKDNKIDSQKKRLDALTNFQTILLGITDANDLIAGRSVDLSALSTDLRDVASWVDFRKKSSQSDWEKLRNQLDNTPLFSIGARQGASVWHLTRNGIEKMFAPASDA